MNKLSNPSLTPLARTLRKNMTKEERHLWYDYLRTHPAGFRRQKVIDHYIVDFYSASAHLAIELDGSQHYNPAGKVYDQIRTLHMAELGITVIRIPNNAVMQNFRSTCEYIDQAVSSAENLL